MSTSPYYPFPPRPGIGLEQIPFEAAPTQLSETDSQAILAFEQGLYDLSLDTTAFPRAAIYQTQQTELNTPLQPLESVWDQKAHNAELGVRYFMTNEGRALLHQTVGVELKTHSVEETASAIASLDTHAIDSTVLDQLVAESVGYEERQLVADFVASDFKGADLSAPAIITVYKNPEVIVAKARGYRQLKTYLSQVKADLQSQSPENHTVIFDAQLVLLTKYRQRINGFMAATHIDAYKLLAQHRISDTNIHADILAELEEVLPMLSGKASSSRTAESLQRLDRYRHGVSMDTTDTFTWLSKPAQELAMNTRNTQETTVDRDIYQDINPEELRTTTITSHEYGDLLRGVLSEYDLLSSIEAWDSERVGPASDNKWQVIVSDAFKSLAVNDKQRIVKVPAQSNPSLLSAVSVGNHELTHVLQHENKRALGQLAILRRIGLDDASEQTEAGGMWQQAVAEQALTGVAKQSVAGTGYYKSLEIKARGGTFGECVQAYYEDLRQGNARISSQAAASQAVNRARRVFRFGGLEFAQNTTHLTNTQPLNYLEQRLIYEQLNDDTRKFLLVGGITIASLVELRQHGLVDTDNIRIPRAMPWQVMHPAVTALLAKKL